MSQTPKSPALRVGGVPPLTAGDINIYHARPIADQQITYVLELAGALDVERIRASLAVLTCATLFLLLSAAAQLFTPIYIGDEKMYHASRVLYWINNNSVFPYTTHNDRQTVFTFGSELFFLWPVLLTKTEVVGRAIFWLGYPFAAIGQYFVLRALALSRGCALTGMLVLISTPIVSGYSVGLKPEMWFAAAVLGIAYWAVKLCTDPELALDKVLQAYVWRGEIEVNFRDEKTLLGVGQAQVRTAAASSAVPGLIVAAYAMLLLAGTGLSSHGAPRARWNRPRPNQRLSTVQYQGVLRAQLWGRAMGVADLTDFMPPRCVRTKSVKIENALFSAVYFAHG